MDVNLSLISEDLLYFPISENKKEIIDNLVEQEKNDESKNKSYEKILREELKNNNFYLSEITNEEYFDIKINKRDKNNKKDFNKKENYDYIIEIEAKDKLKDEIETKINSCMEKEKILINKQNEFKKICKSIKIDETLLEKKLISLTGINQEEYEKLIEQIISEVLDYDNFMKDVKFIQDRLIKYRDSLIIGRCFKIYIKRIRNAVAYIINKDIIFLNNDELFKMVNSLYLKLIKKIIDEIFDSIFKKINDNEIYKNHKEEYEQNLNFYKEVCYLFPILKFFENSQEKEIYELNEDLKLNFSENIFDQIMRVNSQIPKRNGLNITLKYFKEHSNIDQAYEMSLRRILLIYKFKILFPDFKNGSFLYE